MAKRSSKESRTMGKVEIVGDISPKKPTPKPRSKLQKPNRSLPRREMIPIKKPKVRRITKIMSSDATLATIQELAENEASLSTIDATLMFPPNTMATLLQKGKLSKLRKDPYRKFFMLFRKWAAQARGQAELLLAKKSPDKWLDRNTSNKVIESEQDAHLALNAPSNPKIVAQSGVNIATVQKALEILREQGVDINESIDKGEFKLSVAQPEDEDEDD